MSIRKHGCYLRAGYNSYNAMVSRCTNERHKDYHRYGARGITVCERWLVGDEVKSGIECFFEDMGDRPSPLMSIEREDNSLGYAPENCKWATPAQQARNTRRNYFPPGSNPKAICRSAGVLYATFRNRVSRGWSVEEALDPRDFRKAR